MCFDHDSRPPIAPIAGGALESRDVTLTAADGNRLSAFEARAADPTGARIVILPDVRGLHEFYVELALRFAENGVDAVAIDYFGRTAGLGRRVEGFDYMPHVDAATWPGVRADIAAGAAHARSLGGASGSGAAGDDTSLFTVGFCFGGRLAFLSTTLGLDLAGAIGFYGNPVGPGRAGTPAPVDLASNVDGAILGLFGGADQSIPADAVAAFDAALTKVGVEHELHAYDGAPHSFFDRKAESYASESADAWDRILAFIRRHTAAPGGRR